MTTGDINVGTPWSGLTPPRLPRPEQMELDLNEAVFSQEGLVKIAAAVGAAAGMLNVKDYGAIGDGVADDTQSIQDAIDAASAMTYGFSVFVPPGVYLVLNLRHRSNVALVGAGMGMSTLRLIGSVADASTIITTDNVGPSFDLTVNLGLRDLTLDGNRDNQSGSFIQNCNYIHTEQLRIDRVESKLSPSSGFVIQQDSLDYVVTNCWSHDNTSGGFYEQNNRTVDPVGDPLNTSHPTRWGRYVSCFARTNGWVGFGTFDSEHTTYAGCIAEDNAQGIPAAFNYSADSSRHTSWIGCHSSGGDGGISVFGNVIPGTPNRPGFLAISGCVIEDAAGQGIKIQSAEDVSITGSVINNCGKRIDAAGREGIQIISDAETGPVLAENVSRRVTISGNNIYDNGREGIELEGARRITIVGNSVMNNGALVDFQPGIRIGQDGATGATQSAHVHIVGNRIGNDSDLTGDGQKSAVLFEDGTSNVIVENNDFTGDLGFLGPISFAGGFTGTDIICRNNKGILTQEQASASTFDPTPSSDTILVTGTTAFTTMGTTHAYEGREIVLQFEDVVALTSVTGLALSGGPFTSVAGSNNTLTIRYMETDSGTPDPLWSEVSRSISAIATTRVYVGTTFDWIAVSTATRQLFDGVFGSWETLPGATNSITLMFRPPPEWGDVTMTHMTFMMSAEAASQGDDALFEAFARTYFEDQVFDGEATNLLTWTVPGDHDDDRFAELTLTNASPLPVPSGMLLAITWRRNAGDVLDTAEKLDFLGGTLHFTVD